jgi:vancomycin resistance protein YoaR
MAKKLKIKLKKAQLRSLYLSLAIIFGTLVFCAGAYSISHNGKVFKNQFLGAVELSGKTKAELQSEVEQQAKYYLQADSLKLVFADGDKKKEYLLDPTEIGLDYDIEKTVEAIWAFGRRESVARSFLEQIQSILFGNHEKAVYTLNDKALAQKIMEIATEYDQPEKDYAVQYDGDKFILNTERQAGKRIDQSKIIDDIRAKIARLEKAEIGFGLKEYSPQVDEKKARLRLDQANSILAIGPLTLVNGSQNFEADLDTLGSFIKSENINDDLKLVADQDRIRKFVVSIAKSINIEPQSAKLKIEAGKVAVAQNSRVGKTLDEAKAVTDIETTLFVRIGAEATGKDAKVELVVSDKKPDLAESDIASLGINELVGTAMTNFTGSPANRIHNIKVGAAALNGVLLKPGETFSTLAHLGVIDASAGYLEELVIKEDRTVPEFGGGLCQVSSTLFRAAMQAGMKITERQNHKYRVSYYEPPVGMDATIYDPAPDFKFVNTYASHILVQSKVEGTKIYFELYGTKDGRVAVISEPVITETVEPGPPVYVETDTLPAGQKKRIEKPHAGATVNFNYKVTSASGEVLQDKTFRSKYVPWQEKWLVGKGTNVPATCSNGAQDGDETGVDCGGSCPRTCPA